MSGAFDRTTLILAAVAAALVVYHYERTGQIPWVSASQAGRILVSILPKIVCGFLIGTLLLEALPEALVRNWLSDRSGWKGIAIGWAAGSLMPIGAPFVMLPMMAGLLKGGAGMGPVVTLLTATALLGPSRIFVYEIPIMGGGFFLVRFASVFWVPPVTGVIAHFVATRFPAG